MAAIIGDSERHALPVKPLHDAEVPFRCGCNDGLVLVSAAGVEEREPTWTVPVPSMPGVLYKFAPLKIREMLPDAHRTGEILTWETMRAKYGWARAWEAREIVMGSN